MIVTNMLAIDGRYGLVVLLRLMLVLLLMLLRQVLLLRLLMLEHIHVCGRDNGCYSGDGWGQLRLEKVKPKMRSLSSNFIMTSWAPPDF
jgi:hypothetical protein